MPYYEDDLNIGNFAPGTLPVYRPQPQPINAWGSGYGNIGGGGEESSSSLASDHVDDYGNTPAAPPISWYGNTSAAPTVALPPVVRPRPPALPEMVTSEPAGKSFLDRILPGDQSKGMDIPGLWHSGETTKQKWDNASPNIGAGLGAIGGLMPLMLVMMLFGRD